MTKLCRILQATFKRTLRKSVNVLFVFMCILVCLSFQTGYRYIKQKKHIQRDPATFRAFTTEINKTRPANEAVTKRTYLPFRHQQETSFDFNPSINLNGQNGTADLMPYIRSWPMTHIETVDIADIDEKTDTEAFFRVFQSVITDEEKAVFQLLLREFNNVVVKKKLPYFLSDGSLLGSYRHHGMIPWDDDVDLMLNDSLKGDIILAFRSHPSLVLSPYSQERWKVYLQDYSVAIEGFPWKWPFVDLIFFIENSTHLWDADRDHYKNSVYEKSMIFPTIVRPFLNTWLPCPRDTKGVLKRQFNIHICLSRTYSHILESAEDLPPSLLIPCKVLYGKVPFVERHKQNSSTIETLKIGETIIHSIVLENL